MKIFILGLRRSGTTAFWGTFRQHPQLLAFNEPFNPALRDLPYEIPNRSRAEVIDIFEEDWQGFWRMYAPIATTEELQEDLSDRQAAYLRYLLSHSDSWVVDETRCHFKIAALRKVIPDAVVVHLYRHPAAFATSHLIPTGSGGHRAGRLALRYGRVAFWTRPDRFNNWGIEEMVARHPRSLFGQRLRETGMDPETIYGLPAVGKLLAFWRVAWERVEREGPRHFGDRFLSMSFERFCAAPEQAIKEIYAAGREEPPELDTSGIHRPHAAYQHDDPRWLELFEKVGLPPSGIPEP